MKVEVYYIKEVVEIIEVDDKFDKLTESGGYNDLENTEIDTLTNDLMVELERQIDVASYHDISGVWSSERCEIMYEG